ncbi:MAG: hypothetical protein V1839_00115 [archaeon]
MAKKLIYIILDGAADRPIKELGNKTPLEAARKPYLDSLARYSKLGMMTVIRHDIAPESDEAMLALLGYDPFIYARGRGPLEALGADALKDMKNEVILRCNFALGKNSFITETEAVPSPAEMKKTVRLINKLGMISDVETKLVPTVGHRAVLILKGPDLSAKISNANPSYRIVENFVTTALPKVNLRFEGCKPLDGTKEAKKTSQVLNAWLGAARKILEAHKFKSSNLILARGAGDEFPNLHKLVKSWALLADMPVEKAIGKLCGMKIIDKPSSLKKSAEAILENLSSFDCFYIEIKGPDSFAHRGDAAGKKEFIEKIDSEFFKLLLSNLMKPGIKVRICVVSDHTTSCASKSHTQDPVPVMIYDSDLRGDNIKKFGENYCSKGSLRFTSGTQLFDMLSKR